ncbi:hypothetical protein Poli38472_010287 [Pythium oligandrum]|uniref:RING-type domain-containing protein n=1 Tax=Pythium oligandrum TaxID=41045 RepID=A0A8K1C969_PYTOL|nr:hypothetical protein Poli38472_010287 [Pythium oligandrum]|eukprot:TMW58728.1 hypothetical protein Poli38472_010287 [Pythium oligandrum]
MEMTSKAAAAVMENATSVRAFGCVEEMETKRMVVETMVAVERALQSRKRRRQSDERPVQLPHEKRRRMLLARRMQHTQSHALDVSAFLRQRQQQQQQQQEETPCASGSDPNERVCAICLDGLSTATREAIPCGHVFHRHCIRQWAQYKTCCPIDRLDFDVAARPFE